MRSACTLPLPRRVSTRPTLHSDCRHSDPNPWDAYVIQTMHLDTRADVPGGGGGVAAGETALASLPVGAPQKYGGPLAPQCLKKGLLFGGSVNAWWLAESLQKVCSKGAGRS